MRTPRHPARRRPGLPRRLRRLPGSSRRQGGCNKGRREMTSTEPFGLWGGPESYAYPAVENVAPINAVEVLPVPR